jgi:hypothetical protein
MKDWGETIVKIVFRKGFRLKIMKNLAIKLSIKEEDVKN